jgi:hypothetical protein
MDIMRVLQWWFGFFCTLFVGLLFFLWLLIAPFDEVVVDPSFLAHCQPLGLDLLCGPDSQHLVWVSCTAPIPTWKLLPLEAMHFYLMSTS